MSEVFRFALGFKNSLNPNHDTACRWMTYVTTCCRMYSPSFASPKHNKITQSDINYSRVYWHVFLNTKTSYGVQFPCGSLGARGPRVTRSKTRKTNASYHCTQENIKYAESLMKRGRPSVRSIQTRYFVIARIGICEFIFTGKSVEIGMQIWKVLTSKRTQCKTWTLKIISNQLKQVHKQWNKSGKF